MTLSSHHEKLASKAADFPSTSVTVPSNAHLVGQDSTLPSSVSPTPSESRVATPVPSDAEAPSSKELDTVNAECATEDGNIVETAKGERIYVSVSCLTVSHSSEALLQVEFVENDPRNPINFSRTRKWVITITTSTFICAAGMYSLPCIKARVLKSPSA